MTATLSLVADIGGTNARFALTDGKKIFNEHILPVRDFARPGDAIKHYLQKAKASVEEACIAVACPAHNQLVQLTNSNWQFYKKNLQQTLKLKRLLVINDFTALALAVPLLKEEDYVKFGSGTSRPFHPIGVLGPGTGMGMSGLVWNGSDWTALAGEGGHISFAPRTEREWSVARIIRRELPRISAERILTGSGLERLYRAVCVLNESPIQPTDAQEIVRRALNKESESCMEALGMFASALGDIAGDLALVLGAFGGIYLGGGIVQKNLDYFVKSALRARFDSKGRFDSYMREIPTYIIKTELSALKGCKLALESKVVIGGSDSQSMKENHLEQA